MWGVPLTVPVFVSQARPAVECGHAENLLEQPCLVLEKAPSSAHRRSGGDVWKPAGFWQQGTGWPGWNLHLVISKSMTPTD